MAIRFSNNATSRLAVSIASTDTELSVTSGEGTKFPAIETGDTFPLTLIKADGQFEILRCTARVGDLLTITRGQENTSPKAFIAGDRIELRATAAAMEEQIDDKLVPVKADIVANEDAIAAHAIAIQANVDAIATKAPATDVEGLGEALDAHKASGDHDTRYMRADAAALNSYGSVRLENWQSDPQQGTVFFGEGDHFLTWNGTRFVFGATGDVQFGDGAVLVKNGDLYMPWANNYLSTVLAGKQPAGDYLVNGVRPGFAHGGTPAIAAAVGSQGSIEITNAGNTAASAVIAFHRAGQYATYFGLDTNNQFRWGGWSAAGVSYAFWTEANFNPGTKADMGAGCQWNSGIVEFGVVSTDAGAGAATTDIPAPYVMVGLRHPPSVGALYLRGVALRNN